MCIYSIKNRIVVASSKCAVSAESRSAIQEDADQLQPGTSFSMSEPAENQNDDGSIASKPLNIDSSAKQFIDDEADDGGNDKGEEAENDADDEDVDSFINDNDDSFINDTDEEPFIFPIVSKELAGGGIDAAANDGKNDDEEDAPVMMPRKRARNHVTFANDDEDEEDSDAGEDEEENENSETEQNDEADVSDGADDDEEVNFELDCCREVVKNFSLITEQRLF